MAVIDSLRNTSKEENTTSETFDPERNETLEEQYYDDSDYLQDDDGEEDGIDFDDDEDGEGGEKTNVKGTIILVIAIVILALAGGLLIYNMANQRSSQKAIKEWVASYLYDCVAEDGTSLLTDDEIAKITDDVTYKIYTQMGSSDIGDLASATGLSEDEVKTIIKELNAQGIDGKNGIDGLTPEQIQSICSKYNITESQLKSILSYMAQDGANGMNGVNGVGKDGKDGKNGANGTIDFSNLTPAQLSQLETIIKEELMDTSNALTVSDVQGIAEGMIEQAMKEQGTSDKDLADLKKQVQELQKNDQTLSNSIDKVASTAGKTGATGPQGARGEKGEKGDRGEAGQRGAQGNTGATGAQGARGEKGEKGDQGIQGQQGIQGMSVFVRYSATSTGSNMTTSANADTKYIGTYVGNNASNSPSDYSWVKYVGTDGEAGASVWVRYASDATGADMSQSPTATSKYIGTYVGKEPSSLATDYSWVLLTGNDGKDGLTLYTAFSSDGTTWYSSSSVDQPGGIARSDIKYSGSYHALEAASGTITDSDMVSELGETKMEYNQANASFSFTSDGQGSGVITLFGGSSN